MILFDTSVLSRVLRRTRLGPEEQRLAKSVEELLASEAELGLPGVVLQEILSGVRSAKQFATLERQLLTSFTILLATVNDHVEAARLRNKCLRSGISISGPDCLIAVITLSGNHELFTLDQDFARIANLSSLKLYELK